MDRNELIEKAKQFKYRLIDANSAQCVAEAMADFVLSLEAKDEWPQERDVYWFLDDRGIDEGRWDGYNLDQLRRNCGVIFRTEAEANLADRQRIARTAIHRWIAEQAEKVDDYRFAFSPQLFNGEWRMVELQYRIPEWFFVKTTQNYDRMMSENAQHFEVLKEGM